MEPYGIVTYKRADLTLPDLTARLFLQSIEDCVSTTAAPDHRWEVESGLTLSGGGPSDHLLLRRKTATAWTISTPTPQFPQVLLKYEPFALETGSFSVSYAPSGGYVLDPLTGIPTTTPANASPFRKITRQLNNLTLGNLCGGIYVVEYEDAIAFVLESLVPFDFWSWAAMAGNLYYPLNNSDDEYLANTPADYPGDFSPTQPRTSEYRLGDAVLVGPMRWRKVPTAVTSALSWLNCMPKNFGLSDLQSGSVVRIDENTWDGFLIDFQPHPNSSAWVEGLERFSPYFVRSENGGLLGHTKYIRTARLNHRHRTKYVSTTLEPNGLIPPSLVPSQQAWIGYTGFSDTSETVMDADSNNVILWRRSSGGIKVPIIVP